MATSTALKRCWNSSRSTCGLRDREGWIRVCGTIARVRLERGLDDFRDQIVIVGFGNLATIKFAGGWNHAVGNIGDIKLSIDFRGVHGAARFEQQITFFRW